MSLVWLRPYILTGLSAIIQPGIYLNPKSRVTKYISYVIMVLLILAGLIAYFIGASATFEHTAGWKSWSPWYGVPPSH